MIEYYRGPYGANLLFRWHGSALAKAFIPGLLSVAFYLALHYALEYNYYDTATGEYQNAVNHPYAIGVLVSSVSFLIIFRANYGYQRYWEACTTVHQLMSKWMDATAFCSVFHLQCEHNGRMKPPSFFDYDRLNRMNFTREREREESCNGEQINGDDEDVEDCFIATRSSSPRGTKGSMDSMDSCRSSQSLRRRRYKKSINMTDSTRVYKLSESEAAADEYFDETHLLGPPRLDGGWGLLYPNEINGKCTATYYDLSKDEDADGDGRRTTKSTQLPTHQKCISDDGKGFASTKGGRTPSLFLQELAHLSSLLCAVALTTLRNDLDDVESPLGVYVPGQPWPVADPFHLPKDVKRRAYEHGRLWRNIRYLLGMDQTEHSRTIYNAARPMLVIGGVSDNEIAFLQRARGPYAKTQLVWSWLSDFIIREHLAGSLGKVGPPIISRIIQFSSDGMLYYNHARKIMYTPFPFPHAQLSAFFVLMMIISIPLLMDQYANEVWLGATLSFLTVTCLSGLHEVARELENPFRNAPNDVPLCTLLAFYNEALITMFAGNHPDAYWDKADVLKKKKRKGNLADVDDDDDDVPLMPELQSEMNGDEKKSIGSSDATPIHSNSSERPSSAIPQSVDGDNIDSLKELREMIDSQASKIKKLQERMAQKRPLSAP